VMLISTGGTVIKMPVDGIRRMGRATQGVIVMRLRGDERVSSLAPVVEAEEPEMAEVGAEQPDGAVPIATGVDGDFEDPDTDAGEEEDEDDEPDADDDEDADDADADDE
jgi:DNA gyrase subunit A